MTPSAPSLQACIGLMSGTSLDGVDGVVALFDAQTGRWHGVVAQASLALEADLKASLLALNTPGPDELHRASVASQALSRVYADVVALLVAQCPEQAIAVVGAHGQTVRHRPEWGYTCQLLAPALLAELTGLDVACDFRSRDVAAGGQGAPLVPAFHQSVFGGLQNDCNVVLNIGGMANISVLSAHTAPSGFDTGPGNVLMDLWCLEHRGQSFDEGGAWGAQGQVRDDWLAKALADPYFAKEPPKSTGRDLFHREWLQAWLQSCPGWPTEPVQQGQCAADVQATLRELTAHSVVDAIRRFAPDAGQLLVCGGGALNPVLMRSLRNLLPGVSVKSTDGLGLGAMQVEAAAFAWLAWCLVHRLPGNEPAVTGARGPRVLGALYPSTKG